MEIKELEKKRWGFWRAIYVKKSAGWVFKKVNIRLIIRAVHFDPIRKETSETKHAFFLREPTSFIWFLRKWRKQEFRHQIFLNVLSNIIERYPDKATYLNRLEFKKIELLTIQIFGFKDTKPAASSDLKRFTDGGYPELRPTQTKTLEDVEIKNSAKKKP